MCEKMTKQTLREIPSLAPVDYDKVRAVLGGRSVVLVGLMGAGKSTIGKQLGFELGLEFFDC